MLEDTTLQKVIKSRARYNYNDGTAIYWIKIIVPVIIFFTMYYIIHINSTHNVAINIFGLRFTGIHINGIMAQGQIMAALYLTVYGYKKGYRIAMGLVIFGFLTTLLQFYIGQGSAGTTGIIVYIGAVIIISIIYRYEVHLNDHIELVTEQKKKLEELAFYDTLTEIPNRNKIIKQLDSLIYSNDHNVFALVFIDLYEFKKINDLMGNKSGDTIMKMIVDRWQQIIHKDDMLGRMIGDEFALIVQRELNQKELLNYIGRLKKSLKKKFILKRKTFYLDASFGVAVYPQDGEKTDDIFRSADNALQKSKTDENNSIQFFSQDIQSERLEKIQIENALRTAVKNNELYLVYQPQYSCDNSKHVRGYEALLRWESPELGFVSPGKFIPIAEEIGLISEIGEWVINTALSKFKKINERYGLGYILSINISVNQLIEPTFITMVNDAISEIGFDSKYLEFEITESVFMHYPDYVRGVINQLRDLGIIIALDDFGTGYASFSYLLNISIDTLKIDKIFVDSINNQERKKQIVGSIISMAHKWDVDIVAEGV
ncbi:MAG: putative bifunctional diguanylate cyclase/phosphodiesterase, partial [Halanaerobiales bacterium]